MSEAEQDELIKSLITPNIDNVFLSMDGCEFDGPQDAQTEAECLITWFQVNE